MFQRFEKWYRNRIKSVQTDQKGIWKKGFEKIKSITEKLFEEQQA